MEENQIKQMLEKDELLIPAIKLVQQENTATASLLQRKFCIGFPRAMQLVEMMEELNIITKPDSEYKRQVFPLDENLKKYIEK